MAWQRKITIVLVGFGLLGIAGCGTIRAVIKTIIHPDLSVSREIRMTATGMLANMISGGNMQRQNEYMPGDTSQATVEAYWEEDKYHWNAAVHNVPAETWWNAFPDHDLERDCYWIVSYFKYKETKAGTAPPGSPQSPGEEMGQLMAQAMFSIEEQVTMPGKIIDSNADKIEGSTAIWSGGLSRIESGYEIWAVSRRINPGSLGITVGVLICIMGLVLYLIIAQRKGPQRGGAHKGGLW